MKLHRILSISLCIFFFSAYQGITAQNRDKYALLWEIAHKGNDKKSYLFGTFHSRDNKVFQFSDSVIPAIKNSEAFAMEVHPDSISSGLFDSLFEEGGENIYRKVLSEEEYQRLSDRYEELNGEPLDSVAYMNPLYIESMLTKDDPKEGDKATFLDAYLYGVASHYKRDIYGLERLEDQVPKFEDYSQEEIRRGVLDLLEANEEESKKYLEFLKDLYYEGDVDALYSEVTDDWSDPTLDRRNHIMANSMEKIMEDQSLFAAVGAAHLPGDEGIISLMRKKGFTVTKVTPTFNDDPEDLQFLPDLDKWYLDQRPDMGFEVRVPTEPQSYEIRPGVFSMISMDMISGRFFAYVVADFRGKTIKDGYNFTDNILKEHIKGDSTKIVSKKQFKKYGYQVDEIVIKNEEGLLKTLIIPTEKMIYAFMEQSSLDRGFDAPQSEAYYNSINIFPPVAPPVVWKTHKNETGAMSLEAPEEQTDVSREVANPYGEDQPPYHLNMYLFKDNPQEMVYILRYNDQPNGHYIKDFTSYHEELTNNFSGRGTIISGPTPFKVNNADGVEFEVLLSDKYHAIARFLLRGNRTYVQLAQKINTEEKVDRNDPFFTSFEYLPHKPAVFDTLINMENRYEAKLPSHKVIYDVTNVYNYGSKMDSIVSYFSTENNTGGVYGLERAFLKPYTEYESYDSAYQEYTDYILEEKDSLVSQKDIVISGIPGREVLLQNELTNIKQRIQMLLHDDSMFLLLSYLGDEELNAPSTQQFFDSFKVMKFKKSFDPFASKRKALFKGLKAKDSATFYRAKNALSYYTFTEKDVSKLISLLKNPLPDDKKYYNARSIIIEIIAAIDSPRTLEQIKKYYLDPSTPDSDKTIVLRSLPQYKSPEAMTTYFDFLENQKIDRKKVDSFDPFYAFQNSLDLATTHESRLDKLIDVDDYRDGVVSLYNHHVYNDSIGSIHFKQLKEKILNHLVADVQAYVDSVQRKDKPHINYTLVNNYLSIIRKLDLRSSDVSKSLKILYTQIEKRNWLRTRALLTALRFGYEVDKELLQERLSDYYTRYEIMEELIPADKSGIIPEKYWQPDEFTALSIYNAVGYDDEYPDEVKPYGIVTYNDTEYKVFGLVYNDSNTEYLSMAEYKKGDPENLELNNGYTDWDTIDPEKWEEQALQLIKSRLEE